MTYAIGQQQCHIVAYRLHAATKASSCLSLFRLEWATSRYVLTTTKTDHPSCLTDMQFSLVSRVLRVFSYVILELLSVLALDKASVIRAHVEAHASPTCPEVSENHEFLLSLNVLKTHVLKIMKLHKKWGKCVI